MLQSNFLKSRFILIKICKIIRFKVKLFHEFKKKKNEFFL